MNHTHHSPPWWKTRSGLVLICVLGIIGFFLITEHRAHVTGLLPYALLALCPLLHLFGHGGHDHANHKSESDKEKSS